MPVVSKHVGCTRENVIEASQNHVVAVEPRLHHIQSGHVTEGLDRRRHYFDFQFPCPDNINGGRRIQHLFLAPPSRDLDRVEFDTGHQGNSQRVRFCLGKFYGDFLVLVARETDKHRVHAGDKARNGERAVLIRRGTRGRLCHVDISTRQRKSIVCVRDGTSEGSRHLLGSSRYGYCQEKG